jgi:hypothetical protein
MNKLLASVVLAAVAAFGFSVAMAGNADPVVGTWELDTSKSSFTAGEALKSQTRTYSQSGPNISLVTTTVTADGKKATTRTTYQLDGKDYPVMGSEDFDSLSAKQMDMNTAEFVLKKDGKEVGRTTRTVSADGKMLTSTMMVTTASGEKSNQKLVFHRK